MRDKMKRIQSKMNKIGTYNVCKISLSSFFDNKIYLLYDVTNSLTYLEKDTCKQTKFCFTEYF